MSIEEKRKDLSKKLENATEEEKQNLKNLFIKFDSNSDGKLDKSELKLLMRSFNEELTEDEIEDMILQADWDEDGLIDFEEFQYQML
ncbi:hypothetical protein ABK040_006667 [Willaertia magna]